jgi:hypothetical protein
VQIDAAVAREFDPFGFIRQQQPRAGGVGKRQPPADGLEFEFAGDGASERHERMVGLGTLFSHVWGNSAGEIRPTRHRVKLRCARKQSTKKPPQRVCWGGLALLGKMQVASRFGLDRVEQDEQGANREQVWLSYRDWRLDIATDRLTDLHDD